MVTHLPCVKCGTSLSIVEGSLVQCFFCGAKSNHSDSLNLYNGYLAEIINIPTAQQAEEKLDQREVEQRKTSISSYFHDLHAKYYDYKYLILTKIDDLDINEDELLDTIKSAGNFEIIIDELLLPLLGEGLSKKDFQEMKEISHVFNKSLLGLYFSYLAREKYQLEDCSQYYQFAERNYQNIVEYCDEIKTETSTLDINKHKILYRVLVQFAVLLRNILTENPTYSTEKFEDLLKELDSLQEKDLKTLNLQNQIERIYAIGRDTSLLLEEVRVGDIFSTVNPLQENLIFNAEEIIEAVDRIKKWIDEVSNKYQEYQKSLLKLHSGQFIQYLESYRTEFTNRKNKNNDKFDDLLDSLINKALGDYNLETIETLDILNDFVKKLDLSDGTIIQRFEIEHDDLIKLDETLKQFVLQLFKKPIFKDFETEFSTELIQLISGKHSEFDTYILRYIYKLLQNFEDYRNKNVLSMEEQRNLFNSELRMNIKKLLDASFTIQEDLVPYPLFIEVVMLTKTLTVNQPETITLIVENPSLSEIKDINISFFVPRSFQSKLRYAQLKKIKANEKRKIDTEIVPTEKGMYHFMVMIEYQSIGETFWMPSIKFELEVNPEI